MTTILDTQHHRYRAHGKWILAGEHAVLRGCPALVFPVATYYTDLTLSHLQKGFSVQFTGEYANEFSLLYWGVVERALEKIKKTRDQLRGNLIFDCRVPIGAGLGASATLCVSVARWLVALGWLRNEKLYEFSRDLENMFHGESSGVDIAVAIENVGIRFVREGTRTPIVLNWKPCWYLSSSGQRGVTSECVTKIRILRDKNPTLAENIDRQMKNAVEQAERALCENETQGRERLAQAIDLAGDCFLQWGLCERELKYHLEWLKAKGAIAVKPTGSGGGGYALSLWHQPLSQEVAKNLIPI